MNARSPPPWLLPLVLPSSSLNPLLPPLLALRGVMASSPPPPLPPLVVGKPPLRAQVTWPHGTPRPLPLLPHLVPRARARASLAPSSCASRRMTQSFPPPRRGRSPTPSPSPPRGLAPPLAPLLGSHPRACLRMFSPRLRPALTWEPDSGWPLRSFAAASSSFLRASAGLFPSVRPHLGSAQLTSTHLLHSPLNSVQLNSFHVVSFRPFPPFQLDFLEEPPEILSHSYCQTSGPS